MQLSLNAPAPLKRRWRIIGSLLIVAHLTTVFTPPMAFQTRGPRGLSPSIAMISETLAGYGQFLYLDRGYAFFAPDPGPSHLIRVRTSDRDSIDDELADERYYPSLNDQWPRLLYHRHFMLAEFLNDAYQPKLPAEAAALVGPDLTLDELQSWRLGRKRYEAIAGSMVSHIETMTKKTVQIDRMEHVIPDFVGFGASGVSLNDPTSYIELEDIPVTLETLLGWRAQSLPQPEITQSGITEPVPAPTGERPRNPPRQNPEKQNLEGTDRPSANRFNREPVDDSIDGSDAKSSDVLADDPSEVQP